MTVIMPTLSGSIGLPFLSRGTIGMLKLLVVTVCDLSRFVFTGFCGSGGGRCWAGAGMVADGGAYILLGPGTIGAAR